MRFACIPSGLTVLSGAILAEAFDGDTFLGPIFTAPVNVSRSPSLSSSLGQMTQDITTALGAAFGQETGTSVTICRFSIHGSGESLLFDYYHTANDLSPNGTNSVGPDTVFRIGSISKLFTVYQLLLEGGHNLLNEPISRYLDGLPADSDYNANPTVKWDEINLGALASQMGGILHNRADLAGSNPPFQELGPSSQTKILPIVMGVCPSHGARENGLDKQPLVFPAWETPAYSNTAFKILGYIAANVTNMTIVDALEASIFRSLGQPWEIYRQADSDGVVNYYTKVGSIG